MKKNMKRNMKRNTNTIITRKEVQYAQAAQYKKLSTYALRNENYFIAEYYENLSKEVMREGGIR